MKLAVVTALSVLLAPTAALARGYEGHEVVVTIDAEFSTPQRKVRLDML